MIIPHILKNLLTSFKSIPNFITTVEEAWMLEYLIVSLQYMPNILMSLEKCMIILEKLEAKEMKALSMVQLRPFWMNKKFVVTAG